MAHDDTFSPSYPLIEKNVLFMSRGEILIDPDSAHSKRRTDQKL